MHHVTLKASFLAMMYVAREEEIVVDKKYYELENLINEQEDINLTDMIDNIENIYKLIVK